MKFDFKYVKDMAKDTFRKGASAVGDGLIAAGEWTKEHPEAAAIGATALSVGLKEVHRIKKSSDEARKDKSIYDHSLNTRWDTKRKLTNRDRTEIAARRREGEPLDKILKDMGLI